MAVFQGPTLLELENGGRIYCEAGYFDLPNNEALFTESAQYLKDGQMAVGDSIFYHGRSGEVVLIGNARLEEEGRLATADEIVYNEETGILHLTGNAFFADSNRKMASEALVYDQQADRLISRTRSTLNSAPQYLEADTIDFDNKSGTGVAMGNVIWADTTAGYTIICEQAHYLDSTKSIHAFGGRPLLINRIQEDSLYMSADTLYSFERIANGDTLRDFRAYHRVRIYKTDLQAICDSLTYSSADSTFRFYHDPVIWSDTSQFVADSITMFLADEQIDRIHLNRNAFIINSADEILFNQMQGREITAFFVDGDVDRMLIKGNARSIYYVLDDEKAYIGANETECSSMLLRFDNNNVRTVTFYDSPAAKFHPIQHTDPEKLKLEGFTWRQTERPTSVESLLLWTPVN